MKRFRLMLWEPKWTYNMSNHREPFQRGLFSIWFRFHFFKGSVHCYSCNIIGVMKKNPTKNDQGPLSKHVKKPSVFSLKCWPLEVGRKRKRPPGGIPSCARELLLFFIATSGDCQPRSIHKKYTVNILMRANTISNAACRFDILT
jgi:hypothetical protein